MGKEIQGDWRVCTYTCIPMEVAALHPGKYVHLFSFLLKQTPRERKKSVSEREPTEKCLGLLFCIEAPLYLLITTSEAEKPLGLDARVSLPAVGSVV